MWFGICRGCHGQNGFVSGYLRLAWARVWLQVAWVFRAQNSIVSRFGIVARRLGGSGGWMIDGGRVVFRFAGVSRSIVRCAWAVRSSCRLVRVGV